MNATLLIKALRDMRSHAGAYIACALVMAIGVVFYSSMTQVVANLPAAQEAFYAQCRFADAFATLGDMPASRVARLETLDGVEKASGRLTATARMLGGDGNTDLRLMSYDAGETDRLNDLLVTSGTAPSARGNTVCLSEGFARANSLAPGDTIEVSLRGRRVTLTVSGTFQTPEYIYIMPEGSLYPDDEHYGIAYLPLSTLGTLLEREGYVNDVAFTLRSGVELGDIRRSVESTLSPYGLIRLIERKDQPSHSMFDSEVESMRTMVGVVPVLFLSVGALIMCVVIKRMVEQQHTQIGILKAFGYSNASVLGHYALYGVVIGLTASLIGGSIGALVTQYMADLYTTFFAMPGITGAFSLSNVALLSALSLAFGVGASMYGARGVLRLRAAEAMRPPAPPSGKPILLERIRIFWPRLRATTQMSLRNLFRARSRSLMTALGLIVCYALTASVFAFMPMIQFMMFDDFYNVQRYDIKLALGEMGEPRSLEKTLSHMQGVTVAEAVAEIPVTVRAEARSKDVVMLSLTDGARLYRMFDREGNAVPLPREGAVITYRLAEALGVTVGDSIMLDIPYPDREAYITIAALSEQYSSNYLIVEREHLSALLHMRPFATGAMLAARDIGSASRLKQQLDDARNITSVMDVAQIQSNMRELIQTSMSSFTVMAVMAVFAGFAIVYNASVVVLSERTRELASMRVMGFSLWETIRVVATEQLLLCFAGILLGIPLAGVTTQALSIAMSTDSYTMPTAIPPVSHLTAAACMLGAWLAAVAITARKLHRTPMVEVLKERE